MNETKLKPCPFCGSICRQELCYDITGFELKVAVECTNCGARGMTADIGDLKENLDKKKKEAEFIAILNWNNRAYEE